MLRDFNLQFILGNDSLRGWNRGFETLQAHSGIETSDPQLVDQLVEPIDTRQALEHFPRSKAVQGLKLSFRHSPAAGLLFAPLAEHRGGGFLNLLTRDVAQVL